MNNHISQQNESVMTSRITTPPNSSSSMASQESPRSSMFHNSPYTTPTKKDSSALAQNKVKLEMLIESIMHVHVHLHTLSVPIKRVLLKLKNMYFVENLR